MSRLRWSTCTANSSGTGKSPSQLSPPSCYLSSHPSAVPTKCSPTSAKMVHWAWNQLRKCQADGTEERTEIATVRTVGTTPICPFAWEEGVPEPRGPSREVGTQWRERGGVGRVGPGSREEQGRGPPLNPPTWPLGALRPFLSLALCQLLLLAPSLGTWGGVPKHRTGVVESCCLFLNVHFSLPIGVSCQKSSTKMC